MNKFISLILICAPIFLVPHSVYATNVNILLNNNIQIDTLFADDFGELSLSKWIHTDDWKVDSVANPRLKHNITDTATTSYISVKFTDPNFANGTTTWRFKLENGNFSPTTSNKFGYYLMADSSNLSAGKLNGYIVGVCVSGTAKNLVMCRIDAGSRTVICTTDLVWAANMAAWIEVVRQPSGTWQIGYKTDPSSDSYTISEPFSDNTYTNMPYHGLFFTFSKTRAGLLYADDFEILKQPSPICVSSVKCLNATTLKVVYSDSVDTATASDRMNYTIEGTTVIDAECDESEPQIVTLTVSGITGGTYTLVVSGVADKRSNVIETQQINFKYTPTAQPFWLVINELMFDPTPVVGLPNYDYIELFNNSNVDISLGGWTLDVSGTIRALPDSTIKSGNYLIITSSAAIDTFSTYGKAIAGITTTMLTNAGKTIKLVSPEGITIDSLSYTAQSIVDGDKNDGGWSYERIDPSNTCSGWQNWAFSIADEGGTPGQPNSVLASNIDNEPVRILSFRPLSEMQLLIELNEQPIVETVGNMTNYLLKGIGNPIGYELSDNELTLTFRKHFDTDKQLELTISNLTDACGNTTNDTVITFVYHKVQIYDLLISEIMATPSSNGILPDCEWIELYNRSMYDIHLTGFSLQIGSKKVPVDNGIIGSGEYAILTKNSAVDSILLFGNTIGVAGMPTLAQSAVITLHNPEGEPVCQTAYSSGWYDDDLKAAGGYSLERIDCNNSDESAANWSQSVAEKGATPCSPNILGTVIPDTIGPLLLQAIPTDDKTILLVFSEVMNLSNNNASLFSISNIGHPVTVSIMPDNLATVRLELAQPLSATEFYTITVDSVLSDISENHLSTYSATFGLPAEAQIGDIVINEVLFNPFAGGSDFVELYNCSDKALNINDFYIASRADGNIKTPKRISAPGFILMPGNYVALSTNIENLSQTYNCGNLYQVAALPSMPDDAGVVVLIDTLGNVYDELSYSSKMHFALLKNLNGVSLERVDFAQPADNDANWHSASELSGWATPGYQNSVYKPIQDADNDDITLNTEVFSPDNDGYNDQLEISYNFSEAGYVATVTIFNAKGLKIRKLVNNELLGVNGFWAWDGLDDNNKKAPTGIYVIYCEFFDLNGKAQKIKKVCVLSTKI